MNLTFVEKLASQNIGARFFWVAVDVCSRFVSVQAMKTKYANDTFAIFQKNDFSKKYFGLIKEQNLGELSIKFAKRKTLKFTQTMSETKAAFAERAIQSLKHIIYRYIEDHAEKNIHKLPHFVSTMICRVNRSAGKSSRDVKNTDFLSILYNKALTRYKKSKIKFGESENFKE